MSRKIGTLYIVQEEPPQLCARCRHVGTCGPGVGGDICAACWTPADTAARTAAIDSASLVVDNRQGKPIPSTVRTEAELMRYLRKRRLSFTLPRKASS